MFITLERIGHSKTSDIASLMRTVATVIEHPQSFSKIGLPKSRQFEEREVIYSNAR